MFGIGYIGTWDCPFYVWVAPFLSLGQSLKLSKQTDVCMVFFSGLCIGLPTLQMIKVAVMYWVQKRLDILFTRRMMINLI
jgi:hypothetical protein